jgi:hypothetical protein
MVTIKMAKQLETGLLIGELTNGMWITENGQPIYKDTLSNMGVSGMTDYVGNAKIELEDAQFNELTADYFRTLRKPYEKNATDS